MQISNRSGQFCFPIFRNSTFGVLCAALGAVLGTPIANAEVHYDFSTGVGTTAIAYKDRIPASTIPPTVNNVPATVFTEANYTRLVASDENRFATGNIMSPDRAATRYVFHINEASATISSLGVLWEGRAQNGGEIYAYLWNYATESYDLLGSTTSTLDVNITATYTTNAPDYVSESNLVTLLTLNTQHNKGVTVDYIRLSISQCSVNADCNDNNPCTDDACDAGLCHYTNNSVSCSDGNPCTLNDVCVSGACQGGAPPNCTLAGDQCTTASCDPLGATGNCDHHVPRPNGTACDDTLYCSVNDSCQSGVCVGSARDCSSESDQCHNGVCDEELNECTAQPVLNDTGCDDGLYCTVSDVCTDGTCGGSSRDCSEASNQCNSGVCNEGADTCQPQPLNDGTACNDELFCTVEDSCTAGQCSGAARDCSAVADQCNSGACNEDSDLCEALPLADATACDDGLFCTLEDSCTAGACSGEARDCSHFTDACNTGVCDDETNECKAVPVTDGVTCDDGLFCTVSDACASGLCRGESRDCSGEADQCNAGSCNEDANECQPTPLDDGTACDDNLFCTVQDACAAGVCGGTVRSCDHLATACTVGFCNEKLTACTSLNVPEGTGCDDELFCTIEDSCTAGVCSGTSRDCGQLTDQCNTGVCDDEADTCTAQPHTNGTGCDDGLYCTVNDACSSGACTGTARDCSSFADQCNAGECNESTDACVAQPISDGTDCDDLNACNVGESCQAGVCTGGSTPACPGVVSCRNIVCDPSGEEGNCTLVTPLSNGTACSDGLYCTNADACTDGECIGGSSPCSEDLLCDESSDVCVECLSGDDCNDSVACTDDACEAGSCVHVANDTHCPDNNLHCDGTEYCDGELGCRSTGDPCPIDEFCNEETDTCGECLVNGDCNDAVECTNDECVAGGCVYTPDDENCPQNGGFCDGRETCDAHLGCVSTGNPCTQAEFCNEETDVCDECRTDSDCDDGDPCTVNHACVLGTCQAAVPVDCSAQNTQCTVVTCDPGGEIGNCSIITPVEDGTTCDDGLYCSTADQCVAGVCGGIARDCGEAGDQCNIGVCNEESDACESQPVEDGLTCDDGLFCTVEDACNAGLCSGSTRDCSTHADQCNSASCNEEEDSCQPRPVDDGTACNDDLYCTVDDVCISGACHGADRDCTFAADQCNIGVCSEKADACVPLPVTDGAPCQDGLACNISESCLAGLCVGGSPVDCTSQNDQCNVASCDPLGPEGNCNTHTPVDDGTTCDDDRYCSVNDACLAGECVGAERDCSESANACNTGVCNEEEQHCEADPIDDGLPCDDGQACTINDACVLGTCRGDAKDCSSFNDQCNVGVCNAETGACESRPVADGTTCDDGLYCSVEDVCLAGACVGSSRSCVELNDQCNAGVCDEEADACVASQVDDGTTCDDSLFCTDGETCQLGVCTGGSPHDCSGSADVCNAGVCNEVNDICEARPLDNGAACDDGLYCTVNDACHNGACQGQVRDCGTASGQCQTLVCSEEAQACESQPVEDGTSCDDDYACTTNDSCQAGACVSNRTYGLDEWSALTNCLLGPDQGVAEECECSDLDGDGHLDLIDAAEFQRQFDGN